MKGGLDGCERAGDIRHFCRGLVEEAEAGVGGGACERKGETRSALGRDQSREKRLKAPIQE